jgi:hypothetical protein
MTPPASPWQPTTILRHIRSLDTGAETVIVETDQGAGYLKPMGNRGGPHPLACEWMGSSLARRLGLPTFAFAIVEVTTEDEIALAGGGRAEPGPAFISRSERGKSWGGSARELRRLANADDLTRLVLLDTWLRNCDRHPLDRAQRRPNRDNVFFSREGAPRGRFRLKAMDHTHCFTCGRDLTPRIAQIGNIQEEGCYGLFPEFLSFLNQEVMRQTVHTLRAIPRDDMGRIVAEIPRAWDVSQPTRDALLEYLLRRAAYVADHIEGWVWPQRQLDFPPPEEETP